jgi:hypothetical protein
MKLEDFVTAAGDAQLLNLFKIAVKRAAFTLLATPGTPQPLLDWAKRARLTLKDDRSDWYAGLILEGALNEDQAFRDAVAVKIAGGEATLADSQFVTLVNTWVQRFAAAGI